MLVELAEKGGSWPKSKGHQRSNKPKFQANLATADEEQISQQHIQESQGDGTDEISLAEMLDLQ